MAIETVQVKCPKCGDVVVMGKDKRILIESSLATVAIWEHQVYTCPGCAARYRWSPTQEPTVVMGIIEAEPDQGKIDLVSAMPSRLGSN